MKRDMLVNTALWDQFLDLPPPHSAKCRSFRLSTDWSPRWHVETW